MNSWVCAFLICDVNWRSSKKGLGQSYLSCVAFVEVTTPIMTGQLHYLVDPGMFEMAKPFSRRELGLIAPGPKSGLVSYPQRMLLQFIAGLFFKWMSNIVSEPRDSGEVMLCDIFSFEQGHGWALCSIPRQLMLWYTLCYVRDTKGCCYFISSEGVTLCLCTSEDVSETHLSWPQWLKRYC